MILVITSNIPKDSEFSINGSLNDNAMFVMLAYDRKDVPKNAVSFYDSDRFDIYYRDGMDLTELKEEIVGDTDDSTDNTEYKFQSIVYAAEAVSDIADKIEAINKYDPMIILACHEHVNRTISSYLNKYFKKNQVDAETINILSSYKVADLSGIAEIAKKTLNTEFIYQDDPVTFAMVVALMLDNQR